MNIAGMRVRITFQKSRTVIDEVGNHLSTWQEYYACWATALNGSLPETGEEAGHTVEKRVLDFTVRYCSEIAGVTPKEYRIVVGDKIYKILAIDEMGFKKVSRKFHTELVER